MTRNCLCFSILTIIAALVAGCGGGTTPDGDLDAETSDESELSDTEAAEGDYPPGPYGNRPGAVMENWQLPDCGDSTVAVGSLHGTSRAVLVNVAAGWCTICRDEAATLQQTADKYRDDGLRVIQALYQDDDGFPAGRSFCAAWQSRYGYDFPVLRDETGLLIQRYHPDYPDLSLPLNIIVDSGMRIRYLESGIMPGALEAQIEAALGIVR